MTADGRTLVTVTQQVLSRIETVPASGDVSRLTRLTSAEANGEGYEGFDLAPDGRVVFSSYEGGQFDLWVMNSDGGGRQRITSDTHVEDDPTVSPDGVTWSSGRTGRTGPPHALWRIDIAAVIPPACGYAGFSAHFSPSASGCSTRATPYPKFGSLWSSVACGEPVRLRTTQRLGRISYAPSVQDRCHFPRTVATATGIIPASGGRPIIISTFFPLAIPGRCGWNADSRYSELHRQTPDPSTTGSSPPRAATAQAYRLQTDHLPSRLVARRRPRPRACPARFDLCCSIYAQTVVGKKTPRALETRPLRIRSRLARLDGRGVSRFAPKINREVAIRFAPHCPLEKDRWRDLIREQSAGR